jgi:hypothetical protein
MTAESLEKLLSNLTESQKKLPVVISSNRGELVEVTGLGFHGEDIPAYKSSDGYVPAKNKSMWSVFTTKGSLFSLIELI